MFIANLPFYKKMTLQRSLKFAQYIAKLVPENSKVLDFGCGNMFTAIELQKIVKSIHVTGMDVIKTRTWTISCYKTPTCLSSCSQPKKFHLQIIALIL